MLAAMVICRVKKTNLCHLCWFTVFENVRTFKELTSLYPLSVSQSKILKAANVIPDNSYLIVVTGKLDLSARDIAFSFCLLVY